MTCLTIARLRRPLIQAPMAGAQDHRLTAATATRAPLRARAEAAGRGDFSPLWCGPDAACRRPN